MPTLDKAETEIVLVALRHAAWRAKEQVKAGRADGCYSAAWYCTSYCLEKFEALGARLEKEISEAGISKNSARSEREIEHG